jgi:hypothetical protein
MEKGLKNLNQAYRSSQKKQGTYEDHNDSGIGFLTDEDSDDRNQLADVPEAPNGQRVPSIESMLSGPAPSLEPQSFQQPTLQQQQQYQQQTLQRQYQYPPQLE